MSYICDHVQPHSPFFFFFLSHKLSTQLPFMWKQKEKPNKDDTYGIQGRPSNITLYGNLSTKYFFKTHGFMVKIFCCYRFLHRSLSLFRRSPPVGLSLPPDGASGRSEKSRDAAQKRRGEEGSKEEEEEKTDWEGRRRRRRERMREGEKRQERRKGQCCQMSVGDHLCVVPQRALAACSSSPSFQKF